MFFKAINERTDRTWPSTFFAPRLTGKGYFRDVYTVMNNWGDLARAGANESIESAVDPKAYGIDLRRYLA